MEGLGGQFGTNNVNERVRQPVRSLNELGSGGGWAWTSGRAGGNGGGFVRITAAEIVLNGSIKSRWWRRE